MVLFVEILDGPAAEQAGLAWRCVPDDELLATAKGLAATAAAAPRDLVQQVKQTLADVALVPGHTEAVERELTPQVWSINQPAFQERLAAMQRRISSS
jgi:enoyl-CoA hydratase